MRLSAWLSIAAATVTAAVTLSTGCTMDFGQFEPGGSGCGPTEKLCGTACVSRLDPAYGCGEGCTPCNIPGAIAVCEAGSCTVGNCTPGRGDCDQDPSNGCEVDTDTDMQHCGACNSACAITQSCAGGACIGCEPGEADCDGDMANGCETLLGTNTDCASCGDACAFPNGSGACQAGACALVACDTGFDDCDGDPSNGCEIDLNTDPAHCGTCPNACPSGPSSAPTCQGGMCGIACMNGALDCDLDPATGCEIDPLTDTAHCGACDRACAGTNVAAVACSGGLCTSTCMTGSGNCAAPPAPMPDDGCETALDTSVDHCGACNRGCDTSNVASLSCTGGVCDSSCDLGYANCNQPAAGADDGCELNVLADDTDCGGCMNDCSAGLDCDLGPAGQQQVCGCSNNVECDSDGNGAATGTCGAGICSCSGITCAPGEACAIVGAVNACSCNGSMGCGPGMTCCQAPSGCFDLSTNPLSCGACGRACPGGFACQAGSCLCNDAADCNAGSAGAVSCDASGNCVCGGTMCAPGERCQADGQCG